MVGLPLSTACSFLKNPQSNVVNVNVYVFASAWSNKLWKINSSIGYDATLRYITFSGIF